MRLTDFVTQIPHDLLRLNMDDGRISLFAARRFEFVTKLTEFLVTQSAGHGGRGPQWAVAACVAVLACIGLTFARHFASLFVRIAAVWCSVVECVAVWWSVLQCGAVCCSVLQCAAVCCSVLQCAAVCCSVLQCVALRCSVLQCAAVRCSMLQCVAVHCIVMLQCVKGVF